jgi:hypothetical protein
MQVLHAEGDVQVISECKLHAAAPWVSSCCVARLFGAKERSTVAQADSRLQLAAAA